MNEGIKNISYFFEDIHGYLSIEHSYFEIKNELIYEIASDK